MSHAPASVLIVDGDEGVRAAITGALQDENIVVMGAFDGEHALRLLEDGARPCAIILDWSMPFLGGEGFLAARASSEALSRIPVFVTSADRQLPGDPRRQGLLHKPFHLDELLEVVRSVCTLHCCDGTRASCPRQVAGVVGPQLPQPVDPLRRSL